MICEHVSRDGRQCARSFGHDGKHHANMQRFCEHPECTGRHRPPAKDACPAWLVRKKRADNEYYLANKERILVQYAKYRAQPLNRERARERARQYARDNREHVLAQKRAYYQEHREERSERSRIYYAQHSEEVRERVRLHNLLTVKGATRHLREGKTPEEQAQIIKEVEALLNA